jgi:hypothetical protein
MADLRAVDLTELKLPVAETYVVVAEENSQLFVIA